MASDQRTHEKKIDFMGGGKRGQKSSKPDSSNEDTAVAEEVCTTRFGPLVFSWGEIPISGIVT